MKATLFTAIVLAATLYTNAQDLRAKLETSYKAFSDAVLAKDPVRLKSSMGASTYMTLKNRMSSSRSKFPDGFFAAGPQMLKDLNKLKFHKAAENGATANSIYTEVDQGETQVVILKFLKEGTDWKFDLFDIKGSEEINKAAKASDFSFLSGAEYQPTGIVPPVPAEIAAGESKGMIDIFCYGYTVGVTINGNEQRPTENQSSSGWIMGGLKKGKNKITITSKPVAGAKPATITVKIRMEVNDEETTVFSYEQANPAGTVEREFEVK